MKNCFVYLVNHSPAGVKDFTRSLRLLRANYLRQWNADVVAFHEKELSRSVRDQIAANTGVPIIFVELEFGTPKHIDTARMYGGRPGYMHMCQFFMDDIFHHPALAEYTYHCRLDTDSFILSPVKMDLFAYAERERLNYGFIDDSITDQPEFVTELWPVAAEYSKACGYPTYAEPYTDIPEGRVYYTNFEVCRRAWFQSEPWRGFADRIKDKGGMYYYRWGDHTIRYLGVRLFMPPETIGRIDFIHYHHTFEYNVPVGV